MAYYKTRNTVTWNYGTRNTVTLANTRTLAKQLEYHGIVEHEKSIRITGQQNKIEKYYQYRYTTYQPDNIRDLSKQFLYPVDGTKNPIF